MLLGTLFKIFHIRLIFSVTSATVDGPVAINISADGKVKYKAVEQKISIESDVENDDHVTPAVNGGGDELIVFSL